MTGFDVILACLGASSLGILLVAYGVFFRRHSRALPARNFSVRGVTILKPLKGVDEGLRENLLAIINQDYSPFEVIFAAADPNDPALAIARSLALSHPQRDIQIISGEWNSGLNPKVRLLRRMLPSASYDWVLVSDSNVRPDADYLTAMVAQAETSGASLVHSVLAGIGGRSLGGRLEELHLCSWVAASINLSDAGGHPCVIGKSMLMRLDALTSVGGFASVQDILAEDYLLGASFKKAGHRVALSHHALHVVTGRSSWVSFWNRHVRWGQMRRHISLAGFLAELNLNPTPFMFASICFGGRPLALAALFALAIKWSADVMMYWRLAPYPSYQTACMVVLKDLLVPLMWGVSLVRRTVNWRGNTLRVGPGSRLYPAESSHRSDLQLSSERTVRA